MPRKPKNCPRCKETGRTGMVLPIVYGLPPPGAQERLAGKVVFGGCCCIAGDGSDPKWACAVCEHEWGGKPLVTRESVKHR